MHRQAIFDATAGHGGLSRFGIGLCSDCSSQAVNITQQLDFLEQHHVQEIDICKVSIPDSWYPLF